MVGMLMDTWLVQLRKCKELDRCLRVPRAAIVFCKSVRVYFEVTFDDAAHVLH